uniref:Uncharacterized protein n=1 Tax=Romanomermis culicivorax TaxID=13658 RepID=A0A915IG70_ROMCU
MISRLMRKNGQFSNNEFLTGQKLQASGQAKQVAVMNTKEPTKGTYYDPAAEDSLCEEDEAEAMTQHHI